MFPFRCRRGGIRRTASHRRETEVKTREGMAPGDPGAQELRYWVVTVMVYGIASVAVPMS